jgi:hypothetical protein
MSSRRLKITRLLVISMLLMPSSLLAVEMPTVVGQGNPSDDQKFTGSWAGSYSTEGGGTEKLSYILKKDEKGQWQGTVKFTNQEGEQTAQFKSLQIAQGRMKGVMESPDGEVEVTIEGQFKDDYLEGTYSVSPKGTTDVVEKGSWKVTRSAAAKTGQ